MIRVVSVLPELNLGGGENRVLNLARAIDRSRFRHTVVTLYAPHQENHGPWGSLRRQFDQAGVEVIDLGIAHPVTVKAPRPVKLVSTAGTLASAIARLGKLIVSSGAQLVDAHLEAALYTAVVAAAGVRVPSTITLYSELDFWRLFDRGLNRIVFPPLRRFGLRRCARIFTDSKARADDLRRFIGPAAPPVHVIPNGVRLDRPARPRGEVLASLGVDPATRATIVGQIAGLVPFKGQAVLLDAARRVIGEEHDLVVLCIGEARLGPEYPAQLREQARRLGIADRVVIQSYPGNIADVWNVIDVHVHASAVDSLPNAILEGMSLGKPAVVTSVGAVPEHVEDGRTGLVVPPGDPAALATALLRLLGDRELAERLGTAARQRYQQRFTPEVTARQVEQVFEEIVTSGRRRVEVA
jgi:glycosyltransferase involved in cell wall biosynthesis